MRSWKNANLLSASLVCFRHGIAIAAACLATMLACNTASAGLCDALEYKGASPMTGSLIDPARVELSFNFNYSLIPASVTGGSYWLPSVRGVWVMNDTDKVALLDVYDTLIVADVRVDGSAVRITPKQALRPNSSYRVIIFPGAVAIPPSQAFKYLCGVKRYEFKVVASYFTRPVANGNCLTGPMALTKPQVGLNRGCTYNLSFKSNHYSSEDHAFLDLRIGWGFAVVKRRVTTEFAATEALGVDVDIRNIAWNATRGAWIAESVVMRAASTRQLPDTPAPGTALFSAQNFLLSAVDTLGQTAIIDYSDGTSINLSSEVVVAGTGTISP